MKVRVEFIGLPAVADICGRTLEVDLGQGTILGLVSRLAWSYGDEVADLLLDQEGRLDDSILVVVNDTPLDDREEAGRRCLAEGDRVAFLLPAGGG